VLDVLSRGVENFNFEAEGFGLDFTAVNGEAGCTYDKRSTNVCASADRYHVYF